MEFHELADFFPLMDAKSFNDLKADIAENGLRESITIADGKIIDGRNRYNACLELGIEPTYKEWDGSGDLLKFIVSMNLHRRHLDESQRAMVAARLANMPLGGAIYRCANLHTDKVTRNDAAELLSTSTRSVASAKKVLASGTPELVDAVDKGHVAVSLAAQVIELDDEEQSAFVRAVEEGKKPRSALHEIRKEQAKLKAQMAPPGVFNVILADPPWSYDNTIAKWGPADAHYPAMALEDICSLLGDIKLKVTDNAVLFLWAPNPMLEDAFKVIKAWGFTYKTNIAWVKTDLKKPGSGWYVRGRHELCLICTKGAFTPLDENISPPIGSVIEAPVGEHSEKPEELYSIAEQLYPGCSYIELFARGKARDGWKTWGQEA